MIKRLVLLLLLLAAPAVAETVWTSDIRVIDGDTIAVNRLRVRLVGYDTPEIYAPRCEYELALGRAASARLQELLDGVQLVELVVLPGRDRYGRALARLIVAQQDAADILVAEGLARRYAGGQRMGWC